jgi:glycosyltransferase involved in cell wall biosynthesis
MPAASRVSVVLPFYNAAGRLEAAIQSILAQTFRDFELILVDDGSSDASREIARRLAGKDARIRLIPAAHGGIVSALQAGCAEAGGEVLVRMDADDMAYPERIETQFAYLDAHPETALCGCRVRMTGDNIGPGRKRYADWINALITPEDIRHEIFIECPIPHPAFAMRRDAFERAGGYQDHGWPEDYDLLMRLQRAGMTMAKCPEILLDWHDHPRRLSMTAPRYSEAAFRALKRCYLFEIHPLRNRHFFQWGAGEVGKRWLREWDFPRPEAVADINPRKIGKTIHNTPVIAPGALPPPGSAFTVIMVGAPGAREEIRAWFGSRGYRETADYLFLA